METKTRKPFRLSADKTKLYFGSKRHDFRAAPAGCTDQCALCAFEEKKFTAFCEHIPCISKERKDAQDGYFEEFSNN